MKDRYLRYLCELVGGGNYTSLLSQLHGTEFYSLVPNDDNRGVDGEQLRSKFLDEMDLQRSSSLPDGPCSVLEMIIGMAYRLEFELFGGEYERSVADWFWVLIDNLGLRTFDDILYERDRGSEGKIDRIIRILLDREYGTDGFGGLFPLKRTQQNLAKSGTADQRRVELWYQMNAWIMQNYPI